MKTETKEKLKAFFEGPGPYIAVATVATAVVVTSYVKSNQTHTKAYVEYLFRRSDYLAKALDQTTDGIISALNQS